MKYKLSNHALERYWERVGIGKSTSNAENWVNQAITNGSYVGTGNGKRIYRKDKYKIVVGSDNTVVTISYFNKEIINSELSEEIQEILLRKFKKEIKPFLLERKQLLILFHEANIRKLKARSPKARQSINILIKELEQSIKTNEEDTEKILEVAREYYIERSKLLQGGAYE